MVNKEQIFNGIIRYIDFEVMPHLPTYGKWLIGTYITLLSSRLESIYNELTQSPMIRNLDIVTPEGMLDIERLTEAVSENVNKYGKLTVTIPGLKPLTFTREDVTSLKDYITGAK